MHNNTKRISEGIIAQKTIISKLNNIGGYSFITNYKGQRITDIKIISDNSVVGKIESKSISSDSQRPVAIFDITVSEDDTNLLIEPLLYALGVSNSYIDSTYSGTYSFKEFLKHSGGYPGVARQIPGNIKFLFKVGDHKFGEHVYSHKVVSKNDNMYTYQAAAIDEFEDKHLIFRLSNNGDVRVQNTVKKLGDYLVSKSVFRPWTTSGSMPANNSISTDTEVIKATYDIIVRKLKNDAYNYLILVQQDKLYPFLLPDSQDILQLNCPVLDTKHIIKAGMTTYGNAGENKLRVAIRALFHLDYSL